MFSQTRKLLLLAAALFATVAISSCGEDTFARDRSVRGRVTAVGSGSPIEGARVTFVSDTLVRSETTTNGDGEFELDVTTDAPFGQVRAERDGFLPEEKTVFFDVAERRIDLALRPAP